MRGSPDPGAGAVEHGLRSLGWTFPRSRPSYHPTTCRPLRETRWRWRSPTHIEAGLEAGAMTIAGGNWRRPARLISIWRHRHMGISKSRPDLPSFFPLLFFIPNVQLSTFRLESWGKFTKSSCVSFISFLFSITRRRFLVVCCSRDTLLFRRRYGDQVSHSSRGERWCCTRLGVCSMVIICWRAIPN